MPPARAVARSRGPPRRDRPRRWAALDLFFDASRLAGAIAQLSWIKGHPIAAFFVRKKPKEHGARLAVEGLAKGESLNGKRVVIVEDVTTTGGSALKAAEAVRDAGGKIALVFTMVDRDEGAAETFAEAGIPFRSLYKAGEFLKDR